MYIGSEARELEESEKQFNVQGPANEGIRCTHQNQIAQPIGCIPMWIHTECLTESAILYVRSEHFSILIWSITILKKTLRVKRLGARTARQIRRW